MGRNYNEKENAEQRIKRWINTSKDAYGQFVGLPNTQPIVLRLQYADHEKYKRKIDDKLYKEKVL